jgi:uncharacterized protein YkwD
MKRVIGGAVLVCIALAGCGGSQDENEAVTASQQELSDPAVATNEEGGDAVDREGAESPTTGVVEGGPATDVLDQIGDPDLQALAEGTDSCGAARIVPERASLPEASQSIICLVNAERTARGLRTLRRNGRLSAASLGHAKDMVRRRYFAHDTPSGVSMLDRLRRARYVRMTQAFTVGENLAWGAGSRAAPTSLVDAWMASPGHRAVILQPRYREIGIGMVPAAPVASVDGDAVTVTTNFGRVRR